MNKIDFKGSLNKAILERMRLKRKIDEYNFFFGVGIGVGGGIIATSIFRFFDSIEEYKVHFTNYYIVLVFLVVGILVAIFDYRQRLNRKFELNENYIEGYEEEIKKG